jgi:hypothetical protein
MLRVVRGLYIYRLLYIFVLKAVAKCELTTMIQSRVENSVEGFLILLYGNKSNCSTAIMKELKDGKKMINRGEDKSPRELEL